MEPHIIKVEAAASGQNGAHKRRNPKKGHEATPDCGSSRTRPGLVAGAADDDPSGIATYPQAGSAAFALSEAGNWKRELEYMPGQAMRFYGVIASVTLIGSLFDWTPLDPVRALLWSAVLNGLVAVPIVVAMMILVSRRSVMVRFTASHPLPVVRLGIDGCDGRSCFRVDWSGGVALMRASTKRLAS